MSDCPHLCQSHRDVRYASSQGALAPGRRNQEEEEAEEEEDTVNGFLLRYGL